MLSLTFYGGVGQIGGNKVLVEDGHSQFFLDFGTPYAQRYLYFEEYLNPRSSAGLLDPLEMGLLPPLRGIYRPDLEPPGDLWGRFQGSPLYRELSVDGVLLSHAHLDHAGYISFLRPDIPIYATPATAFILKAMQDSSRTDFEREVCYAVPRQPKGSVIEAIDYKKAKAQQRLYRLLAPAAPSGVASHFWRETPGGREVAPAPLTVADRVGGLPLRYFPVDHSIPGACALGVETSVGWVIYTGDLRFHGGQGPLTRGFVEQAAQLQPTLLLGEGSNVDEAQGTTEAEVYANARQAVAAARALVVADFAPRNVERLLTFHRIAAESGRALVLLNRDIYLVRALHLVDPAIPDLATDPHIRLYDEPRAKWERWERQVREWCQGKLVTPQAIHRQQEAYILCFSFFDINEFPSLRPAPGSLYLYSSSEAYNEEQELDFRRLLNWVAHFGMTFVGDEGLERRFHAPGRGDCPFCSAPPGSVRLERGLHASGHASGLELLDMIQQIRPRVFIPIHTENPGFFQDALAGSGIEVRLPSLGVPMSIP